MADYDLNLLFEPIQTEIRCVGEGLFMTNYGFIDDRGKDVGSMFFSWGICGPMLISTANVPYDQSEFSEGWCILYNYDLKKPVSMNRFGEVASFCR